MQVIASTAWSFILTIQYLCSIHPIHPSNIHFYGCTMSIPKIVMESVNNPGSQATHRNTAWSGLLMQWYSLISTDHMYPSIKLSVLIGLKPDMSTLLSHLPEVLKATGNAPKEWRHSKLHQLGSSNTFSIHPLILGISLSYWNLNYHICTENKPRANCCCAKTLEICWLSRAEQPRGVWNQIAEQSWVRELLSWAADLQPVQQRIGTIFFI